MIAIPSRYVRKWPVRLPTRNRQMALAKEYVSRLAAAFVWHQYVPHSGQFAPARLVRGIAGLPQETPAVLRNISGVTPD